ncbi:MAG: non-ribosomal peptide synthetase [Steroidobacteraceae bacterium]
MMIEASTLVELLDSSRLEGRGITHVEGQGQERRIGYTELRSRALGLLWHLQQRGAQPGDTLILFVNDNVVFLDGFWGGLAGGLIPVPLGVGISEEHRLKLLRIAARLHRPWLLTDERSLERLAPLAEREGAGALFRELSTRSLLVEQLAADAAGSEGRRHLAAASDTAFIQFSSGSTSTPKGVVLTHANLLVNARGATEAAAFSESDRPLSWMPLTHDMGLIGMVLMMMANGMEIHLMPTDLFIRRPLRWLEVASERRCTLLASPNFGYRHLLRALETRELPPLDLSAVRILFNGAEPINASLCREFLGRMAGSGLRQEAMLPVYGLAEASLAVSFPPLGRCFRSLTLARNSLQPGASATPLKAGDPDGVEFVCEGRAIPGCALRVVDDSDQALAELRIGHVQIRGGNVTAGYLDAPQANAEAHTADGWLRTGDLGFIEDGELFITGRQKEVVIVHGQNFYPHDLEGMVEKGLGLELGKLAMAGCSDATGEDVLVAFVTHRGALADFLPLAADVARMLNEQSGLVLSEVVPVPRIPKTTSGKVQRAQLARDYQMGSFAAELAELARLRGEQAGKQEQAATTDDLRSRLTLMVSEALGGRSVGLQDNLFDIGTSSLELVDLQERLDAAFPGVLELPDLFDHPSIDALAALLTERLGSS